MRLQNSTKIVTRVGRRLLLHKCVIVHMYSIHDVVSMRAQRSRDTAPHYAIQAGRAAYNADHIKDLSTVHDAVPRHLLLRAQRLRWVGHVLRRQETFPARRVLVMEQKPYEEGSVLMDTEGHFEYDTMEKLAELAENREKWN